MPAQYHEGIGNIKCIYYAQNGQTDGSGNFDRLLYGGEPSGLKNHGLLETAEVFPTVFSNQLKVKIPSQINGDLQCDLFDPLGRKVYSMEKTGHETEFVINIPDAGNGLYILRIRTNHFSKNFKIFRK